MNHYLFFLGQNGVLSRSEIESLLPKAKLNPLSDHLLEVVAEFDFASLACKLGGTTKIARKVGDTGSNLQKALVDLLLIKPSKNFSILLQGKPNNDSYSLSVDIKAELVRRGHKKRFLSTTEVGLTPLVIDKQKVTELIVTPAGDIYETIWTHDYKHWIVRDRNKPFITPKSGMLPPKLARIMVNLALTDAKDQTLLDPFCGTGTILMEAALLGTKVIGSDLSPEKVQGTHQNLEWLPQDHACESWPTPRLLVADATNISKFVTGKVDCIVTEPTLGPASPQEKNLKNIARGLQKLYLGALKDWHKILKPGAKLVIAFPLFHGRNQDYKTTDFIDARENLGYNVLREILFTRPGAQIERQIVILQKI